MSRGFPAIVLRYITAEFVKTFALTLVIATGTLAFAAFIGFIRHSYGVGPRELLMAVTPLVLMHLGPITLPIALLFGASISYGRMSAENEIRAMEWNGIHVGWIILPAVVIAFVASASSLYMSVNVTPWSERRIEELGRTNWRRIVESELIRAVKKGQPIREGDLAIRLRDYNAETSTLLGVQVIQTAEDKVILTIDADSASLSPGSEPGALRIAPEEGASEDGLVYATVTFSGGKAKQYDPDTGAMTTEGIPPKVAFAVQGGDRDEVDPDTLSFTDLAAYAKSTAKPGDRRKARTLLFERVALGVSPLFFAILAVPMAMLARWKHALTSFLPSLTIVVAFYYPLMMVAKVQGQSGAWDPLYGMFAGNAALLIMGAAVTFVLTRR